MSSRSRWSVPPGLVEPCLPSVAERPPSGADWVHEIKHDGYRRMSRRDSAGIRLLTRNGHDWASRYPLIVSRPSTGSKRAPAGESVFRHACKMGFEGVVSKRLGAIDEQPVDLVCLLLLPKENGQAQLNTLAAVARRLRSSEVLEELRRAPNRVVLYNIMVGRTGQYRSH